MVGGPEWAAAIFGPVLTVAAVAVAIAAGGGFLIGWLVF